MEKTEKAHNQVKEEPKSRARYERLREIEREMQTVWNAHPEDYLEANAPEDYSSKTLEQKNKEKYMVTFPFPYMNGYLHLGHAFSMSKAEFSVRYQRQRGRNALFPFGFHCTGMPIQAAANRLKREIETGKTVSEDPMVKFLADQKAAEEAEKAAAASKEEKKGEEAKKGGKGGKKDNKKDKKPECPPRKYTQYEVLQQLGIPEADIPTFTDPVHWLKFFPPKGLEDLKEFGVCSDWRRSFITTDVNPYYDSFVQWQFRTLLDLKKIIYGKKYTIYSERDRQPCADHDRASGEGVGPQEYVGIKLKMLEFPDSMKEFIGKNVYMVAATLRPETMYGQTNCYVLPSATYGVYQMINDEYFVMSERAARNFAHQEMTPEFGKYPCLANVTGQELIGKALKAPLTKYEKVYALPMTTILMTKGTGIVTSVPSDSPDDWAALRDLQSKEFNRNQFGVKEEWCVPFEPIPIITIPDFGDMCAVKLVDDLKIKTQKDKDLLAQAKEMAYKKGFYEGKMMVGIAEGEAVETAKPKVKQYLFDEKLAVIYYEPEKEVISRTEDQCVVACTYQWFLRYGEDNWKEFVRAHLKGPGFEAYNAKTLHEFELIIDWLKEWGCTRTQGLGTLLPWDNDFKIESLSDSTIYMAYYTVAHMLQGGELDGSKVGPLGVKAEDMNDGCWDFIFKKGPYPEECKVPLESLQKMRNEFEYWYPMDMRVSAKDLIRNHLTMCLYNHAAIWEDHKMMPKSMFCNGYMVLNGQKMSKSTGNFLTVRDCIDKFGVDATRLTLADAGDSLDDANFDSEMANGAILKLFTLEAFIKDQIAAALPDGGIDFAESKANMDLWDKIFDNYLNQSVAQTTQYYDEMKFKQALQFAFFTLQGIKEDYLIAKERKANPYVIMRYVETQLTLLSPITPHFAQYCWKQYAYPIFEKSKNYGPECASNLMNQPWPLAQAAFDKNSADMYKFLGTVKSTIRNGYDNAKSGGNKKKAKKGAPAEAPKAIEKAVIFVANEYPEFQKKCLQILQKFEFDEDNKIQGDYIAEIRAAFDKKQGGLAMKFVSFQLNIAEAEGKDVALRLEPKFDEAKMIESNKPFLFEQMKDIKSVEVLVNTSDEAKAIEGSEQARENATPSSPTVFFC